MKSRRRGRRICEVRRDSLALSTQQQRDGSGRKLPGRDVSLPPPFACLFCLFIADLGTRGHGMHAFMCEHDSQRPNPPAVFLAHPLFLGERRSVALLFVDMPSFHWLPYKRTSNGASVSIC
eukprot:TRINITY_DN9748_c0_g2_i1.p2 TRINITY_DN9748_c0_g2~~TRINITY_DN9748_c0_g2_i1.p2  ORF type:complete len:121 (-),score=12.68 TRINITY_DN9748_c0_g2_i1:804-1166(-)